jgi:hypothetical protein
MPALPRTTVPWLLVRTTTNPIPAWAVRASMRPGVDPFDVLQRQAPRRALRSGDGR